MPPGRRRIPTPGKELIIPLALGLTAAIASVGLYLWSDTEASYSPGNSDDEWEKERKHRRPKTRRRSIEQETEEYKTRQKLEHVTEEDTDDLEEDRRRYEQSQLYSKGKQTGTLMSGALQLGGGVGVAVASVAGRAKDAILPGKRESETLKELKREAAMNQQQFVPPPMKKKSVTIVVSERKALEGHDSDEDFEEAGLPSSLLSHLPHPLDLSSTALNILILSPHLSTHPLSHHTEISSRTARNDSVAQSSYYPPRRMPSPNASTYTLATSVLPKSYPLEHILPFTDPNSIVPLLRTVVPEIVYIEEPITIPSQGALVAELLSGGWVGCVVVVLVGEDDQFAALADTDDDEESPKERKTKGEGRWWGDSSSDGIRAKFGNRVQIVEGWVLMEDWRSRIDERV